MDQLHSFEPKLEHPIQTEALRFEASGLLGRSRGMSTLFVYLVRQSIAGKAPKEIEIAHDVFGRSDFDALQDACVRVYVSRLRKKLLEFYQKAPCVGVRLVLPRGEYRLALENVEVEITTPPAAVKGRRVWRPWSLASIAASMAFLLCLGFILVGATQEDQITDLSPWHQFGAKNRHPVIVAGDYYIFGEADSGENVVRLVREFDVNSKGDLDQFLMSHPEKTGQLLDLDLHYLPTGVAAAVSDVSQALGRLPKSSDRKIKTITASDLSVSTMRDSDLVYVGYLSGMGLLRDLVFGRSHFRVGSSYDELIDAGTRTRYMSDWSETAMGETPRRDYGYLACLKGPAGNHILVIAGTRDSALMQMAEIVTDSKELAALGKRVAGAGEFEALYEVQTFGNTNLSSSLKAVYPLSPAPAALPQSTDALRFPDQMISVTSLSAGRRQPLALR